MTLQEYLAQEDPVRMPDVILQEGEYEVWNTAGVAPRRFTHISIPAVKGSYSVNEGDTQLYTQDAFGYPKSRSCFHLPHPVQNLTHYERVGDSYNPEMVIKK
jgi:hypothetical protein